MQHNTTKIHRLFCLRQPETLSRNGRLLGFKAVIALKSFSFFDILFAAGETMQKKFNITGVCVPGKHYMVDISEKISAIETMVLISRASSRTWKTMRGFMILFLN